jgi:hypothetical protein
MKNFLIFLKNYVFKNISVFLLLLVIVSGVYNFNQSADFYVKHGNLDNFEFKTYYDFAFIIFIVLSLIVIVNLIIVNLKGFKARFTIQLILVYCIIMFIVLFFMLVCLNEMSIKCGYGNLNTPLNIIGWIHSANQTRDKIPILDNFYNYSFNLTGDYNEI